MAGPIHNFNSSSVGWIQPLINASDQSRDRAIWSSSLMAGQYMAVISTLGIVTNILALCMFSRHPHVLHAQMHLIQYVCISHLLMAIIAFPFITVSCIAGEWVFGDPGCQFYGFFMTTTAFTSVSLLAAIALQRLLVVVSMQQASKVAKLALNRRIGLLCLTIGLTLGVLPFAGIGTYDLEPGFMSCTPKWWGREKRDFVYIIIIFICAFFLPVSIICASYIGISIKIRSTKRTQISSSVQTKYQLRLAVIALLLIAFFFVSWGPYAIVAMLQAFDDEFQLTAMTSTLPVMLAKSCVLWDPVIYTLSFRKFREALKSDICRVISCIKPCKSTRRGDYGIALNDEQLNTSVGNRNGATKQSHHLDLPSVNSCTQVSLIKSSPV